MQNVRAALTLDDAPSIDEPGIGSDPEHMDAIRETLKSAGVRHCVAFVVGRTATGHEATLRRWLDDGYELGNHTFDHLRAPEQTVERFVRSVRQCHELLESVGAFTAGRVRWFRFPYASRGRDAAARSAIQQQCHALGYQIAHLSVDLFDHCYDRKLAEARRDGDTVTADAIGERYREVAWNSMCFGDACMRRALGRSAPLVPYCHFGWASREHLADILARMREAGVELCSLQEALADPVYREFDADYERDGLLIQTLPRSTLDRVKVRLARIGEQVGIAEQRRVGPRWPYLQ